MVLEPNSKLIFLRFEKVSEVGCRMFEKHLQMHPKNLPSRCDEEETVLHRLIKMPQKREIRNC
jgi:hypothetical protein